MSLILEKKINIVVINIIKKILNGAKLAGDYPKCEKYKIRKYCNYNKKLVQS